jgi:hypothetical protein
MAEQFDNVLPAASRQVLEYGPRPSWPLQLSSIPGATDVPEKIVNAELKRFRPCRLVWNEVQHTMVFGAAAARIPTNNIGTGGRDPGGRSSAISILRQFSLGKRATRLHRRLFPE